MRQYIIATYAMNAIQFLSMGVFALGVPALISFAEYGHFVFIFAVPGLIHGMVETALVSYVLKQGQKEAGGQIHSIRLLKVHSLLYPGFLAITFLIFWRYGTTTDMIWACVLLTILYARSITNAFLFELGDTTTIRNLVISAEAAMLVLVFALFFVVNDYRLPLAVIILNGIFFISLTFWHLKSKIWKKQKFLDQEHNESKFKGLGEILRMGLTRIYEDGLFTLLPMLFYLHYGSVFAGQYRLTGTVGKILVKLFPFRADILQTYIRQEQKEGHKIIPVFIGFSFLGIFLYGAIYLARSWFGFPDLGHAEPLLLVMGACAVVSVGLPLLNFLGKTNISMMIGLVVFSLMVISMFTGGFVPIFIIANSLAAMVVIFQVHRAMLVS